MNSISKQLTARKARKIKRERYEYYHISYNFSNGSNLSNGAISDSAHGLGGCQSSYIRFKGMDNCRMTRVALERAIRVILEAEDFQSIIITNIMHLPRKGCGELYSDYKEVIL